MTGNSVHLLWLWTSACNCIHQLCSSTSQQPWPATLASNCINQLWPPTVAGNFGQQLRLLIVARSCSRLLWPATVSILDILASWHLGPPCPSTASINYGQHLCPSIAANNFWPAGRRVRLLALDGRNAGLAGGFPSDPILSGPCWTKCHTVQIF